MRIRLATENRKAVATRLAEIIGGTSRYTGVPRCAYEVGPYFIEKDGTITISIPVYADLQPLHTLAEEGLVEPFETVIEPQEQEADATETGVKETAIAAEEAGGLTIYLPKDGFTEASIDNLRRLVESKATLIQKALSADRITIDTDGDKVSFPWWDRLPKPEETQANISFITELCRMAKEAKRVTATEKDVENEKYAFRCFLLRLGFIGADRKAERRLLLLNLSGSSAFKSGHKGGAENAVSE